MITPIALLGTVPDLSHYPYVSVGMWNLEKDGSIVATSLDLGNPDYNFLIAFHELVECYLCHKRNISDAEVTNFDMQYETDRLRGLHSEEEEPGDDKNSPYRKEHFFASILERLMADQLGVDWPAYEEACLEALS